MYLAIKDLLRLEFINSVLENSISNKGWYKFLGCIHSEKFAELQDVRLDFHRKWYFSIRKLLSTDFS